MYTFKVNNKSLGYENYDQAKYQQTELTFYYIYYHEDSYCFI